MRWVFGEVENLLMVNVGWKFDFWFPNFLTVYRNLFPLTFRWIEITDIYECIRCIYRRSLLIYLYTTSFIPKSRCLLDELFDQPLSVESLQLKFPPLQCQNPSNVLMFLDGRHRGTLLTLSLGTDQCCATCCLVRPSELLLEMETMFESCRIAGPSRERAIGWAHRPSD